MCKAGSASLIRNAVYWKILYLSLLFHLLISISALPTNTFKGVVVVFKPIMLLWLVIMRLQGLIPVIVSLRSSESERRWCGFTPRGGKHGRGHKPLTDGRSRLSPTPPSNQRPRRPMRLALSPPIKAKQPIAANQGRTLQLLLWIQRGTTERSRRKKGKVIQERKKLMVVVHARRGGGLYFSIDQIVEDLRPQSAPDAPTDQLLWDGLSAFGTGSWI